MKKIFVLVAVFVLISVKAFSINEKEYSAFYKLNNKVTFNGLIGYIDADQEQARFLEHVFKVTADQLRTATQKNSELYAENILDYNFRNTKCILTDVQYKKYLEYINVYLNDSNTNLLSDNTK